MQIWKYQIYETEALEIELPNSARVVHVVEQGGKPTIWVQRMPDDLEVSTIRRFIAVHTEQDYPNCAIYQGTAFCDPLFWHVLEVR